MREFIYFSQHGRTSGNFKDLMSAGRLDIACHVLIAAFFLSHKLREDVKLHIILNGPPDPPKHLEFISCLEMPISKKDVGTLLKIMLFKYRRNKKIMVFPGCYIEKKSFQSLVKELSKDKTIYLLDQKGEDMRNTKLEKDSVFILGDYEGIPKTEKKFLKRIDTKLISIGKLPYFSSQVIVIVNNELDREFF